MKPRKGQLNFFRPTNLKRDKIYEIWPKKSIWQPFAQHCWKRCQQHMSYEIPAVIIASLFPKFPENLTALDPKIWPSAWIKCFTASSSIWISMRLSWMVESHSLMLVSWQKGISPSHALRNPSFGVISATEWCFSKPQTAGGRKIIFEVNIYRQELVWLDIIAGLGCPLS